MHDTMGSKTCELPIETVLSSSLKNGWWPFVIGKARPRIIPFRLVDEIVIAAGPLTRSVLFTQRMPSLSQLPHTGDASSHFFLRARHVRQPELDFSLPI